MSNNILTKEAIDELVSLFSSGQYSKTGDGSQKESYEKIHRYNFKAPNRFTKDQIRTLRSIYETFATALSSHLSGLLRKYCQIELISVEEHTYSEYSSSLINPVLLGIVELPPLQGSTLIEISHLTAYAIIDRLLGGPGQYKDAQRNYTEIEVALLEKLVTQFLEMMRDSWSRFHDVKPKLDRIETNSQFAQIVPLNETIAIVTFAVRIGDVEGIMNYCIPHLSINSVFKNLKIKNTFFQAQIPNQESKADEIINIIQGSPMEVVCTFADTIITAKDVMSLQVGDVITLDNKLTQPIKVNVNNRLIYKGMIGTKNNKLTIKISDVVEGEIL